MRLCYANRRRHAFRAGLPWLTGCAVRLWAGMAMGAAVLAAQSFTMNQLTTAGVQQTGFRIYNISAYTGYSTVDSSWNAVVQSVAGTTGTLPTHSTLSGVSAALGFHSGAGGEEGRTAFSVIYSPSYSYTTYGQSWSMMTHTFALSLAHKLAPRWQLLVGISGVTGNFNQFLFSPTNAQNLATAAGTAEQLASTILTGQGSTANTAATVTAQQRLFYGDRMLSAAAQVALSYAHSPRLGIGISLNGNRMQHLREQNVPADQNYYLIPQSTDAAAALSISYMLSERTSVTGAVSYGRALSALNDSQYTSAQTGLGRKLTQRWFGQFSAGGGYILPVGRISTGVHGSQWQASAGLGYRGTHQSIIGSVGKSVSDFYGLGAAATLNSSVGWSWYKPGARWALQAGGGQDKLLGKPLANYNLGNNGIRGDVGIYWMPDRRTTVVLQYAYVLFSGTFPGLSLTPGQQLRFAQHSVRLNLGWGTRAGMAGQGVGVNAATP